MLRERKEFVVDSVSIAAVAGAFGGVAGKVAEKTWDSAEKWLSARFGSHAPAVRVKAGANAAQFVQLLAERVRVLEEASELSAATVECAVQHPQFSAMLHDALLNAAQTDDSSKHGLLADIVAVRLAADAESTVALASPLAVTAVSRATPRQLHLLGLICVVGEIRPKRLGSEVHFRQWLTAVLKPFQHFQFYKIDALHLAALAATTFDPTSQRSLSAILNFKGVLLLINLVTFETVPGFLELQGNWDEGLAGVQLTSVGSIIGGLVFNQLSGARLQMPKWP